MQEEAASPHPVLKVWDVRHVDKQGSPKLLVTGRMQHGSRPHPASTFAITPSLSHAAVGLADGTVLLLRHLDQTVIAGAASTSPVGLPKIRVAHTSTDPVTGLGFAQFPSDGPTRASTRLYIVTTAKVLALVVAGSSSSSSTPTVLDDIGGGLNCSTVDAHGRLILARDEAIYAYGREGRENTVAYEGAKHTVVAYSTYLVIASPPALPSAASASKTVRNYAATRANGLGHDVARLGIFDLALNIVAHSTVFEEGVRDIWTDSAGVCVLANDGKVRRCRR